LIEEYDKSILKLIKLIIIIGGKMEQIIKVK